MITTKLEGQSPVAYAALFNQGLERVFEVSKSSLDLAVEHHAEVLASYRRALKASSLPGLFVFDLAGSAFEGYVALQKRLLNLAIEQPVTEAVEEDCRDTGATTDEVANGILQSVDRMIADQESMLAYAAEQIKAVSGQPSVTIATVDEIVDEIVQLRTDRLLAKEIVNLIVQSRVDGVSFEAVADIVHVRVNTANTEEGVDLAANFLNDPADPFAN